jgi:hypothetical protein
MANRHRLRRARLHRRSAWAFRRWPQGFRDVTSRSPCGPGGESQPPVYPAVRSPATNYDAWRSIFHTAPA